MLKTSSTAAIALISLLILPAHSEEPSFYASGFVGAAFSGDADLTGTQNPVAGAPGIAGAPASVSTEFDSATTFGVGLGYDPDFTVFNVFNPRFEIEYSTFEADVDRGSFNNGSQPFSGDTNVEFFLLNSYNDIIWKADQSFVPFVGGGIGVGSVDANILYAGGGATTPNFAATGESDGLAGTIAMGLTYVTGSNWEVYTEGRYYQIRDLEFERRFIGNGANLLNARLDDDFDGTSLTIGARLKF